MTYEEWKQNYATVIANSVITSDDADNDSSFKCISSLANSEKYDKLISKWLEDNLTFDTKTNFIPIYKKAETDKILEIVDPNYKKRTSATHSETPTERKQTIREKPSFKTQNIWERRDSTKNNSRPPSSKGKIQRNVLSLVDQHIEYWGFQKCS